MNCREILLHNNYVYVYLKTEIIFLLIYVSIKQTKFISYQSKQLNKTTTSKKCPVKTKTKIKINIKIFILKTLQSFQLGHDKSVGQDMLVYVLCEWLISKKKKPGKNRQ